MECHRVLGFMKEYAGEVISPAFGKILEGSVLDGPDEEVTQKNDSPGEVDR
jgi:hypothetical protein